MSYANYSKSAQTAILAAEAASEYFFNGNVAKRRTIEVQYANQTKGWKASYNQKLNKLREMFPSAEGSKTTA